MSRPMLFKVALYCVFLYSVANGEGLDDIHVLNVGNDLQQLLTSTRRHAIRKPEKMIHQESAKIEQVSTEFHLKGRAASSSKHEVIFSIQQQNMDILENQLKDISDPFSANFGKHLSRDEIATLTMNQESADHVMEYLRMKEDVKILKKSKYLEYITVSASVATWESLFDTTFHEYEYEIADTNESKVVNRIIRAEHYSLPENIASHVDAVFNTVQFPDLSYSARRPFVFKADESGFINIYDSVRSNADATDVHSNSDNINSNNINSKNKANYRHNNIHLTDQLIVPNAVTPAFLSSYYNMSSNTGSSTFGSQGIYAALEQAFSPSDLAAFQTRFQLPLDPVDVSIGNHSFDNACSIGGGCAEANLDIQYIMSTSQLTHTTFYYWTGTDFLLQWFMEVANMANPPLVFSISYGSPESSMSTSYLTNFNTQAVKLSAMGVTIVAASGDDGAVSHIARNNPLKCGYFPSFPTTSPYVTAVGGTQGPDQGKPEIACQGDKGGVITTGGGFSAVYARHEWQDAAVAGYFSSVLGTAKQPYKGYENRGRGFPDVSLIATSYLVMMGGSLGGLFGTSATSPVFAGMISLVNGKRLAAGKSALGWINPSLYAFADKYILNDITDGWNNCVAIGRVCCSHGFTAVPGWDPVTGLGSIDYGKFEDVFFHLGDAPLPNTPTKNPVVAPTRVPASAVTAFPTQGKGWFYSTTYTGLNCNTSDASESSNTVNQVSGMATDTCFTMYNDNGAVSGYVKVICYPDYVLLNRYSSSSCAAQFRTYVEMIFTGCASSVNLKPYSSIHSVGLQCTPTNIAKLPLPQTGKYVTQLTYASTSSCTSATSSFISFRQDRCLPELVNDQIMSFKFALPTRTTYTGNTCSSGATSTNLDTNCHFTDDSVWTELGGFHNNADAYYDDTWLQQTRLSTKWTWNSNLPTMAPTPAPSRQPSRSPSATPSVPPSAIPSASPSISPSQMPSVTPSAMPSVVPSVTPSKTPTVTPTVNPSVTPSVTPSRTPTVTPTIETSAAPSAVPSGSPSTVPSITPSSTPTTAPSVTPSATPSALPTVTPTVSPSSVPTQTPSTQPSALPSAQPSITPTSAPSTQPTTSPSVEPTVSPSSAPSAVPTTSPSSEPTISPSSAPSEVPTATPSASPSILPTPTPTLHSDAPTVSPSAIPTSVPSVEPSKIPTTEPTTQLTVAPTQVPSEVPSVAPSQTPSETPSEVPSVSPSITPSEQPSELPSELPSEVPTVTPSQEPSTAPSEMPTTDPSTSPSQTPSETPSEVPSTAPSSSDQSDAPTASHSETPSVTPSSESTITPTTTPSQSPSQLPSITPSTTPTVQLSNSPTTTPSTIPSSAPTTVPTASPTPTSETRSPTPVPSASQSYEFSVQQGMDGVSADTYRSNEVENNAVFCKTVTVTLDLPTSACKVYAVSDKPTTRKLRNTGTHEAQHTLRTENNVKVNEVTASVLIDYLITYNIITLGYANQPGAAYDTLIATLTTAITNNDFAALLQEYASQNSIEVFDAVTLAEFLPSTYTVAPDDTSGGDSSSGGNHNVLLIAVLCGVIGGLLCLSPCVYAYWFYNYGKNGSSGGSGNGTQTPKKVSDHAAAGDNDTTQYQEQQQKQHGVVSGYSVVPVTPSEENL